MQRQNQLRLGHVSFPALYAVNEYLPDFSLAPCDFFCPFLIGCCDCSRLDYDLSIKPYTCSVFSLFKKLRFLGYFTKVKTYDRV